MGGPVFDLLAALEAAMQARRGEDGYPFFWFRRAGKGQRELRLMIHDGPGSVDWHRELLKTEIQRCLTPETEVDAVEELPYAATPEVFGGPPFTEDKTHLGLATRFLGVGCRRLLPVLGAPSVDGDVASERDLFFARLVGEMTRSLGMSDGERVAFLVYYRDWLIRWPLMIKKASQAAADQWVVKLEQRAAAAPETTESLGRACREACASDAEEAGDSAAVEWHAVCGELGAYLRSKESVPEYRVDPFSENLMSPPVCKPLLSLSNALGYGTAEQAQVFHAMIKALGPERALETIPLRPKAAHGQ